ncbi:hypothetical protein AGLY_001324 [Aphis glycines]|uniref:Endonuclease/exonuclease/phosphatase domain-containing protein n=1 Tax=Aphis glycines TaxID=307491 RepID=A0A6G0U9H2_APHGL|nr:hypothetical protein AGLY_001324 [Aphis glycines]
MNSQTRTRQKHLSKNIRFLQSSLPIKNSTTTYYTNLLLNLIGENSFHCKSTQKHSKVQANTSDGYLLRNLHPSTSCEEIKSALENLNFSILLLSLSFFVDLAKDENCKTIFDITSILYTKIKVEEPLNAMISYNARTVKTAATLALIATSIHPAIDAVKITNYLRILPWKPLCQLQRMSSTQATSKITNSLIVLLWNSNGILNHINELTARLHDERIDIALISESHLTDRARINISGYTNC